ncbi:hypothetical protein M422DRAFT_268996 [Sphaerobolus stellatus SS14]|uniref:Uncharacterized protein n=1 Tax=Sphaerobolus stellatus (strain SS14) TaxID=990650 RepID=A0A0C9UW57_SPHS4|nr:hypothetical protein M422DRAFT_268996 [Sphaerobolus stellatus SS14]
MVSSRDRTRWRGCSTIACSTTTTAKSPSHQFVQSSLLEIDDIDDLPLDLIVAYRELEHRYWWYWGTFNPLISKIPPASWKITPSHTNIVESAHRKRNDATGVCDSQIKELKQGPLAHIRLNGRRPKSNVPTQSQVSPSLSYRDFGEVDAPLDFDYEIRDTPEAFEPLEPVPAAGTIMDDNFWQMAHKTIKIMDPVVLIATLRQFPDLEKDILGD